MALERLSLGVGQRADGHEVGFVPGDQPEQPGTAGDHHYAGVAAGQQWNDLTGAGGVVEHDQHPLPRDQTAEQRGPGVGVGGDAPRPDTETVVEPSQRLDR